MWPLVMYSNYFEIVSTVTFLDSRTGLISGIFLCKTVILYHHTLYNDYTRYNICSGWFLDILISTCFMWPQRKKSIERNKGSLRNIATPAILVFTYSYIASSLVVN